MKTRNRHCSNDLRKIRSKGEYKFEPLEDSHDYVLKILRYLR